MKVYVAGVLADMADVRVVQAAVLAEGHELTLDWTTGADAVLPDASASRPTEAGLLASADLAAVLAAEAVLVVASAHDGRGVYVELGAALARAASGDLEHVVVIGPVRHESVFHFHPLVLRVATAEEWLATLT